MKSILGIGNALTDILVELPDDTLLRQFHLPKGSMQHVDKETGNKIWRANTLQEEQPGTLSQVQPYSECPQALSARSEMTR